MNRRSWIAFAAGALLGVLAGTLAWLVVIALDEDAATAWEERDDR